MKGFFRQFFGYILISFLFITSCKDDSSETIDLGYTYFPVNIGHWVIYDVDSVVYGTSDTTAYSYQIKEYIESAFTDNTGKLTQRIERYKRENDTLPWVITQVWTSNLSDLTAERVEDNQRYIKLIFPVRLNESWNANSYNNSPPTSSETEYTSVDEPYSINSLSFDSTLTTEFIYNTFISIDIAEEMYAKNVGLIYKRFFDYDIQSKIGLDYYMTISSYSQ